MTVINKCKCGQPANQIIILKGDSIALCERHVEKLEQVLGEKIKPLTTKYHVSNIINNFNYF
jgi:hypothetical protein